MRNILIVKSGDAFKLLSAHEQKLQTSWGEREHEHIAAQHL